MSLIKSLRVLSAPALFLAAFAMAGSAQAALSFNMPQGVTEISREVYHLHMLIFWICVVIGIGVFGVMIWSLVYHRKSRGHKAAQFHESTAVEIAWTVVPFVILIGMAIPAAGTLIKIEDSSESDITIKTTGYQWLWEYEYLDQGVQIYSRLDNESNKARQLNSGVNPADVANYLRDVDNRVIVPVDKKVRLLLTSNDVIHAWWVPELGGKKDAIPGYINEMWFKADEPGVYRGQCAELCGRGHAYMPIVVEAVSQEEFDAWVKEQGGTTGDATQVADASAASDAGAATTSDATADTAATADNTSEDQNTEGAAAEASVTGEKNQADGDSTAPQTEAAGDTETASAGAAEKGKDALMAQGKEIYNTHCAACHQADGSGLEAAGFPAMKGSKVATGPVGAHIKQTLNGQNAMPPFKGTLSDEQIAAVITYERNAFGNDTGDVVQPAQVKQLR